MTNEKETCLSVSRNEPASALLGRPKQDRSTIVFTDNGKVVEEGIEEHIPPEFVNPEIAKPAQISQVNHYEDDFETYPVKHRSSSYVASGSVTSPMPLSPSEQVRDVLTRKHRSNSLSPSGYTARWTGASYYSAREFPGHGAYPHYNERLAATERLDRERVRPFERYSIRESDSHYADRQHWNYYHHENGYPSQYGVQSQMPARPEYAQPVQAYWSTTRPNTSAGVTSASSMAAPSTAWAQYTHYPNNSYPQQTLRHQVESQWETLYTDEGYPYYVNRIAGVSQWEKPVDENVNGSYTSPEMPSDVRLESLAPDAIIRMRLAEARKQKSQTALVSPVSSLATSCSTPTIVCQPVSAPCSPELINLPNQESREHSITKTHLESESQVAPATVESASIHQQPVAPLSEPSKYEARTGLKLSVDIAAPPAQDGAILLFAEA